MKVLVHFFWLVLIISNSFAQEKVKIETVPIGTVVKLKGVVKVIRSEVNSPLGVKMSLDEASKCAASIVSMYGEISGIEDTVPVKDGVKKLISDKNLAERMFWAQSH